MGDMATPFLVALGLPYFGSLAALLGFTRPHTASRHSSRHLWLLYLAVLDVVKTRHFELAAHRAPRERPVTERGLRVIWLRHAAAILLVDRRADGGASRQKRQVRRSFSRDRRWPSRDLRIDRLERPSLSGVDMYRDSCILAKTAQLP